MGFYSVSFSNPLNFCPTAPPLAMALRSVSVWSSAEMERFVPDLQQLAALAAIGSKSHRNSIFFFGIVKVVAHGKCDVLGI
jgi:hypothetical protein